MWLFCAIFVCIQFLMVHASGSCDEVYKCPNATFDSSQLMDYEYDEKNHKWKMTMHLNYLDVFCPYFSEILPCIKDNGATCDVVQKKLFGMMKNTYNPICITYKAELNELISLCYNDPVYQEQLVDKCYDDATDELSKKRRNQSQSTANPVDCGIIDKWASCAHDVIKACSPENAHAILPIVEAAKPYICMI
ncbi:unnamed protein product [Mytilus coruscus]|uniref:Uncharacterized protein n=1 Tax=Mytilus coruscus TaxID=42192 RepID=A0A6J8DGF0_MYTCO|nr:unnamed protein product [Mytilus coruscus]